MPYTTMRKISNKLVIFGAVAAAALAVPGVLGPLMFEDAYAAQDQRQGGLQNAAGVVAANVGVQAQVGLENNDIANCLVVTGDCSTE
jgi:hypothetical protein